MTNDIQLIYVKQVYSWGSGVTVDAIDDDEVGVKLVYVNDRDVLIDNLIVVLVNDDHEEKRRIILANLHAKGILMDFDSYVVYVDSIISGTNWFLTIIDEQEGISKGKDFFIISFHRGFKLLYKWLSLILPYNGTKKPRAKSANERS